MNKIPKEVYEPEDDSKLLLECLKEKFQNVKDKKICEIGIGSGFISKNFQKSNPDNNFYASDINPFAIEFCKKKFQNIKNFKIENCSFFENFKEKKFDLIYFNTPYLPCEDGEKFEKLSLKDKAIYGGKRGYEVILNFIKEIPKYLSKNGKCLMLFSSLSNEDVIKKELEKNLLEFKELKRKRVFFEELIVYEIKLIKELNQIPQNIKNTKFFSKGKRSIVLEGNFDDNEVIIKISKEEHIRKEKFFLEKLKSEKFIPKVYFMSENVIIMEKIKEKTIKEFLEKEKDRRKIKKVLDKIVEICKKLDELNINKKEMTNPYKHIFISEDLDIKMIDFERALFTKRPKNENQFKQYLRKLKI